MENSQHFPGNRERGAASLQTRRNRAASWGPALAAKIGFLKMFSWPQRMFHRLIQGQRSIHP